MDIVFNILKYFSLLFLTCSAENYFTNTVDDVFVCVGKNKTLNWQYNNQDDLFAVYWYKDDKIFLLMVWPSWDPQRAGDDGPNVRHISNGKIELINVRPADTGNYSIRLQSRNKAIYAIDHAFVTVTESPAGLSHSISIEDTEDRYISVYTCTINQPGEPPVDVKIKIDSQLQIGSSFEGTVTKSMECCVFGEAARCMPKNTNQISSFCNTVYTPYGPTNLTLNVTAQTYILNIGETLDSIACKADCDPPCTYSWTKHGNSVSSDNGILHSVLIKSKLENGTYTCTATRRPSFSDSVDISLFVKYGPDSVSFYPKQENYTKTEGESLQRITCEADCYPGCTFKWIKGTDTLADNATLLIRNLTRGNSGTYTCTAERIGTVHIKEKNLVLHIRYGPDSVTLYPPYRVYKEPENSNFSTITCHSECYPECRYKWVRQGIVISNNNSLALGILQKDDKGEYICNATNPFTGTSNVITVTVRVQYGPDDVVINQTCQNCTENEGYTLPEIRCQAQCYPRCSYRWTKNGTDVSSNASLLLGSLDKNEAGKYICTATNTDTHRMANGSTVINVRYGPDEIIFSPPGNRLNLSEGDLFPDKACTSDCYPGCSQYWTNIGTGTVLGTENILALGIVYRNDTAEYRCTSSNQALQKSTDDSIFLTVKYFPDVKVSKFVEGEITELNKSFTIECVSAGIPDAYTYFNWTHLAPDGLTKANVYKGQVEMNRLRLTKEHPSYMDSGVYLCRVTNGERDYPSNNTIASSALNITVKGKPLVTKSDPKVDGAVGKHVKLNVSFFSNDETNPAVTWFKIVNDTRSQLNISSDGKFQEMSSEETVSVRYADVFVNQEGKKTQLEISNIEKTDFGYYETEIVNSIGNISHRLELVPRGPPSLPTNLTIVYGSETATSITLMWFPGFHGGAEQTFYIEYKTHSTQWVNGSVIPGGKSSDIFNATVGDLLSGTEYIFQLYAKNEYGRRNTSVFVTGTTTELKAAEDQATAPNVGLIAGGATGGVVMAAIIVVLALLFLRKRQDYLKSPSKRLLKDNERSAAANGANDTPEINVNPMYEPAGPLPSTSNNSNVYSEVNKNRKNETLVGDIYSKVEKPKKLHNAGGVGVNNDVYAQVQKKTHKEKDAGNSKHKKQKADKKTKKGKQAEGDLYDNVDTINSTVTKGDNVYENPSCGIEDEHPKQKRNQDGLIYVDLDLPKEAVGKDRKAVIHGFDDRTDYADIKFGEVGEQAPESDEENKNKDS